MPGATLWPPLTPAGQGGLSLTRRGDGALEDVEGLAPSPHSMDKRTRTTGVQAQSLLPPHGRS